MNTSFYTGAVGAYMQNQRMNVQANNLANVNNIGFKAERVTFHHLMYSNVVGIDEELLPKGSGTKVAKATIDFETGGYNETGRTFDFAIQGDGFFALYDATNGEVSFTRDGAFIMARVELPPEEEEEPEIDPETGEVIEPEYEIDPETGEMIDPETGEVIEPPKTEEWRLSDNEGRFVLDSDGNFIVIDLPLDRNAEVNPGVFDYRIYDGMLHLDSQRFTPIAKNGDLYLGTGTVIRGYLERSNTDVAQEMTKVIESQRAYSMALRMVQTSDEIEQTINGLPN